MAKADYSFDINEIVWCYVIACPTGVDGHPAEGVLSNVEVVSIPIDHGCAKMHRAARH